MTAASAAALAVVARSPAQTAPAAVFGDSDAITGQAVVRLAALLDPGFLAEAGWDPATWVLAPPAGHRLIRWDAARLDARAGQPGPGRRDAPLPVLGDGKCAVLACLRARRVHHHRQETYCAVHARRWAAARRGGPVPDQRRWNRTAEPLPVTGQVNLRGLAPLVVAELLYGLQQRVRAECTSYCRFLRRLAQELRQAQVSSLSELPAQNEPVRRSLASSLLAHLGRAFADPRTEIAKDRWDLTVLGHHGWLTFTGISQRWLREAVKGWAAHDLPRHRGKQAGARLNEIAGAMVRLSATLRAGRPDQGENPAELGRADIEAFLHRLAFLSADGQLSAYCRTKTCQDAGRVLTEIRSLGLTRSSGPAAGLADDFTLTAGDVPAKADPGEPGRDVPAEIMRQICGHLRELEETVSSRETRIAVELLMDTGRRPAEICTLEWDCLVRDADGTPVLVYDNAKAHRLQRRLPVSEHTATLITDQKLAVRERFPATPPARLKLLPSRRLNPIGSRPVTEDNLIGRHRIWLNTMGSLQRADGTEYDKTLITPYSYRHSYAQRHADAGVPVNVLRELMDHTSMDATKRYYRVGEARRREAVNKVTAMQFDRHGNRVWRQATALLDSEHARYAIGAVAVPYGTCGEPSNVQAGGGACPVRFRCAGCDHFRTDVSHLPDLTGYLDDLLRTRERLQASVEGVDEWARADALPSTEEITRVRRLISRIKGDIAQLPAAERTQINEAVTVVRRHRAVHLGMPGCPHCADHVGLAPDGGPRMTTSRATTGKRGPAGPASPRTAAMAKGRQADSARRRQRVIAALNKALADGAEISVSGIARAAGVDRTFFYRHRDLLAQIHALEATPPATGGGTGPAVTRASLQADLLAAGERGVRLNARVQQLERRLSEILGEQAWRECGLGHTPDLDQLRQQASGLQQQIIDLRLKLEERDEELTAARTANRELMGQLNHATRHR